MESFASMTAQHAGNSLQQKERTSSLLLLLSPVSPIFLMPPLILGIATDAASKTMRNATVGDAVNAKLLRMASATC
jgi:hypothetical protein